MSKEIQNDSLLRGRIIVAYKDRYTVETKDKRIMAEVSGRIRYTSFKKSDYPVVGDYVYYRIAGPDFGIIEKIEVREKVLSRLDVGDIGEEQILASNVDIVFICMSLNKDFNIRKLQNFMTLTYGTGIETVILLTKKDLTDDIDSYIKKVKEIDTEEIIAISSYDKNDIEIIRNRIGLNTVVFLGSSGVGKSTIINALSGEDLFLTNEIRESDAQGRHMTSHRELVTIPGGGKVIDTPGLRIVSSYFTDETGFSDILSLAEECQFRDCTHTKEPNCNVLNHLYDGRLAEERYDQYLKAMRFSKFAEKRQAERERLQNKRKKY